MRYELNFDEDKIIDIEAIGDNGVLGLKDCCKIMNKQEAIINKLKEENDNMNLLIKQTIQPLLFNCVFELDTIESMSQVELARKIEDEIIPFIQDFKYLTYESLEEEKQDKSE